MTEYLWYCCQIDRALEELYSKTAGMQVLYQTFH
jgi:hypothetical protein